ncbi:hypothetical protein HZI73_12245 [Vallitalea pronyensis]|uniref:Uncharacterized protein n=1 Tax=Vallitalea pronyensis TaxID=1348613 RepID=A0A8J8MK44_9FIRM|nr:hypothetical protein [Vallitalea pronyensis]QUI23014.1 hypothetical protein HZI73_12245 [Vallitalea pronyensis]
MLGIVISSYKGEDPLGVTIAGIIFVALFVAAGGLLIYFGRKMFIVRESAVNIALKTFRENGYIDYTEIQEELKVNEVKARKYILWAYRKKLFFKIDSSGIMQTVDLLDKKQ